MGAQGIGRATARLLSEHGASVVVTDLDDAGAQAVAAELGSAVAVGGDITAVSEPERIVAAALDEFGGIDIIVNNAGYNIDSPVESTDDEMWARMIAVHATAPFRLIRAAAPHLLAAARADLDADREVFRKIVNVSSLAMMGSPMHAAYGAGKSAVIGLSKTAAKEWAPLRINVNAVAFGGIDTRLNRPHDEANAIDVGGRRMPLGRPPTRTDSMQSSRPLGRLGSPEEAAGGIFLLCTPWANWITGQTLVVSGGGVFGMSA